MSFKICMDVPPELMDGIAIILPELGGMIDDEGILIEADQKTENKLKVKKCGKAATITYKERIHFFRALGLLAERADEEAFEIEETVYFDTNGVMFDVSQSNTLMTVEHAKRMLRKMALMGLNLVMFYNEDNYEIDKWPYFGYMRSRYTQADIKEIDDYAYALGIEQVPCIQTLAHLTDALKWPSFSGMRENKACLLPEEDRVYEFIEDAIAAATKSVRSKRIHIGMDEAMRLGMGNYYKKHGLTDAGEIMLAHLNRVMEMLKKHGLEPMLWGDMFLQRIFGEYSCYCQDYGKTTVKMQDCVLPNGQCQKADLEMLRKYPRDARVIAYEYSPAPYEFWDTLVNQGKFLGREPIFAGGIWGWTSFCPNWRLSFDSAIPALEACKNNGIREVFATSWGDEQTECPVDALLLGMQLWAEMGYSEKYDEDKLRRRYEFITGADYEATKLFEKLDAIPGTGKDNESDFNASKCLLWQETMCGIHDKDLEGLEDEIEAHYGSLAERFYTESLKSSCLREVFELYSKLAHLLEIKATIGCRLKKAYDSNDRDELLHLADRVLPELVQREVDFYEFHRAYFYKENKPFGFEIFDIRHAAIKNRARTAQWRLHEYLEGRVDTLGELDEEKKYMHGAPSLSLNLCYPNMISASRISADAVGTISRAK